MNSDHFIWSILWCELIIKLNYLIQKDFDFHFSLIQNQNDFY
jgi:hypothetical protein